MKKYIPILELLGQLRRLLFTPVHDYRAAEDDEDADGSAGDHPDQDRDLATGEAEHVAGLPTNAAHVLVPGGPVGDEARWAGMHAGTLIQQHGASGARPVPASLASRLGLDAFSSYN